MLLIPCVLLVMGVSSAYAGPALKRVHAWRDRVWVVQELGAWPRTSYHYAADQWTTRPATRWFLAVRWYHRYLRWDARLDALRHPSQAACYRFVRRRFAPLGTAAVETAIVVISHESGCYWAAQNPASSAAGVAQFVESWGPLWKRLDVVWSVNRMRRAVEEGGWSPWAETAP